MIPKSEVITYATCSSPGSFLPICSQRSKPVFQSLNVSILSNLFLGQEICVFLVWVWCKGVILPQLRAEVSVCTTKSVEQGADKVTHCTGVTGRTRIAVINSGHVHQLLSGWGRNQTCTARSRDQTNADGTTLSGHFARHGVGHSGSTSPVTTSDWNNIKFGSGDGTTNSGGNFSSTLNPKADMSSIVSDSDEGLKTGTLTGRRLLLDRHDLHDLILKLILKEEVNDFSLLHRKGIEENFFNGLDLSFLYQTSKLGDRNPDVLITASTSTATSSAASTTTPASTAATETASSSIASAFASAFAFTGHDFLFSTF
mmetsp:Transcript_35813/g.50743  ORF Transcript_35813/g.50743 Transcript_35813/m.50743 type:complete len:314 (+) Transcript_35813:159-1100(+)